MPACPPYPYGTCRVQWIRSTIPYVTFQLGSFGFDLEQLTPSLHYFDTNTISLAGFHATPFLFGGVLGRFRTVTGEGFRFDWESNPELIV